MEEEEEASPDPPPGSAGPRGSPAQTCADIRPSQNARLRASRLPRGHHSLSNYQSDTEVWQEHRGPTSAAGRGQGRGTKVAACLNALPQMEEISGAELQGLLGG